MEQAPAEGAGGPREAKSRIVWARDGWRPTRRQQVQHSSREGSMASIRATIYNRSYRHPNEVVERLLELVGECGGHIPTGSQAEEEWNALAELRDSMIARAGRLESAAGQ